MAKEISRSYDTQQRRIVVTLQDDLGHTSSISIFVTQDKCPCCGGAYAMKQVQTTQSAQSTTASVPDVDTIVQGAIAQLDEETTTAQAAFTAAGMVSSS